MAIDVARDAAIESYIAFAARLMKEARAAERKHQPLTARRLRYKAMRVRMAAVAEAWEVES